MGFWNVKAVELQPGDEIRVRTMGGEEYLEVLRLEKGEGSVRAKLDWGFHVNREPFWEEWEADKPLTVRR